MHKKGKMVRKIITFIGSFLAALSIVAQFFPEIFSFSKDIPNANGIVFVCIIIMLLALFFMNWKQSLDENDNKLFVEHESTHKYAHLIRDTIYKIEKISKSKSNNVVILHILKSFSNEVVSCIADNLYALFKADSDKNEISVCIKILDFSEWENSKITDKSQASFYTLSRSFISRGSLQADDAVPHKISECTAFYRIFVERKHDWTGINLSSKNNIEIISEDVLTRNFDYTDSCQEWKEHYTNRIVVPIRVKLSEIYDNYQNSDERNLFGFICVEYKKSSFLKIVDKYDKDLISVLDLLKSYADMMYIVYDTAYKKMKISNKKEGETSID